MKQPRSDAKSFLTPLATTTPVSSETTERDPIKIVLDELDEIDANRRVDEFFRYEAEMCELTAVLGIHDEELLGDFIALGFTPRTAPAIEMLPIVRVAWASGEVTDHESAATVAAIHETELAEFPETWNVVQSWLRICPGDGFRDLWMRYVRCRLPLLTRSQRAGWHERLLIQSRRVAKASGGWLGIGSICPAEQSVIDDVDRAFHSERPRFRF